MIAAKSPNEEARLAALYRYDILDAPAEESFDDITKLIAYICDTPIAIINLVDADRQYWVSEFGLPKLTIPLEHSFCAHAILENGVVMIPDTTQDARFATNPLVTENPNVRFYAGAPLLTPDGHALGNLCVLDYKARTLTSAQSNALECLARAVMSLIELRRLYDREKNIAETLQRSMLLRPKQTRFPGLAIEMLYYSAWAEAEVGGDFFDVSQLADGNIALVVGDVAGKGLKAATRTAETKFALRVYLRETASPSDAVTRLNRFLCDSFGEEDDTFVALTVAVVSPDGTVRITLAGAESPFLRRSDGTTEQVSAVGMPVGIAPDAQYTDTTLHLGTGDLLLLLTDGVTEARRGRDFWGVEGVDRVLRRADTSPSLLTLGETVVREAREFAGGALRDDVCLLLACRY